MGVKFRRQHPIGSFFVDFCCTEANLIVEVDGGQHALERRADTKRTTYLEAQGYRVLRFWNNEALSNTDAVLQRIALELATDDRSSPPPPSPPRPSPPRPSPYPLPRGERDSEGPTAGGERDSERRIRMKPSPQWGEGGRGR
jgi:hypothetical protein